MFLDALASVEPILFTESVTDNFSDYRITAECITDIYTGLC